MKLGREKGEKIMMETKLVLLGTGTPNACPDASGSVLCGRCWRPSVPR